MANTFNGIGTTYYGKKDIDFDGSFITTKWFVVGFFPIIPLSSCRLRDLGTSGIPFISRSTEYQVIEELPLNAIQVLSVYLYSFFIIAWTGYMLERNSTIFPVLSHCHCPCHSVYRSHVIWAENKCWLSQISPWKALVKIMCSTGLGKSM